MKYCSVYSCETNNLCKKTFLHEVRKEWISLVKWKTLKPNLICSSHFEKTFYNGKRLKDNAVPTIFHKLTSIILKEHDYCLPSADMTRKLIAEGRKQREKGYYLKRKNKVLQTKISNLEDVVVNLTGKFGIEERNLDVLKTLASSVPSELLNRIRKKKKLDTKHTTTTYHPAIKNFALTLHMYSAQAYR